MTPESPADQPPNDASGIKIHNWSDAKDPIGDNTELVRYMKLETFLLMLNSRVFHSYAWMSCSNRPLGIANPAKIPWP